MVALFRTAGLKAGDLRQVESLLSDRDFWAALRDELAEDLIPIFRSLFDSGAELGLQIMPARRKAAAKDIVGGDPNEINLLYERTFRTWWNDWWVQFESTTQNQMRNALVRARQDGTGVEGVIQDIAPIFGSRRGRLIAVTETTRLFGLGAMATYGAAGLEEWAWQTVRDAHVCTRCALRQGHIYSLSETFAPEHPGCRCFPKPVVPPEQGRLPGIPAPPPTRGPYVEPPSYPKGTFSETPEIERWLGDHYSETIFDFSTEYAARPGEHWMDKELADSLAAEFSRLANEYPEVQKKLRFVGTGVSKMPPGRELGEIGGNTYAWASRDGTVIRLNTKYFGAEKASIDLSYADDIRGHWHAATLGSQPENGVANAADVLTHEYGHQLMNLLEQTTQAQVVSAQRASGLGGVRETFLMWKNKNLPALAPTVYGQSSFEEKFAEAFVIVEKGSWRSEEKNNFFVRAVAELLDALSPAKWRREIVFTTDLRAKPEALRQANEEIAALMRKLGLTDADIR